MARTILEYTSFDEVPTVGALTTMQSPSFNWNGTATSLVAGWNGSGQAVRGPSALRFVVGTSTWATIGARFRFRLTTLGLNQQICGITTSAATPTVGANTSNQLRIDFIGLGTFTTSTTVLQVDVWYDLEWALYVHNTLGHYRVALDGNEISTLTATGVDTYQSGTAFANGVTFTNGNEDVDDVVLWGVVGDFADSDFVAQPGQSARMVTLRADGQGSYTGWTNATGIGGHWEEVDEPLGDGDISHLTGGAIDGTRDSVTIQPMPTADPVFQIVCLRTLIEIEQPSASQGRTVPFLRKSGANFDGTQVVLSGPSYEFYGELWPSDPSTSILWTSLDPVDAVSTINSLEVGVKNTNTGTFVQRVSLVALVVLYISAPPVEAPTANTSLVAKRKTHYLTKTLLVQRTDGISLAFTDHDKEIELDTVLYSPTGGFSGSAIRRELMLKDTGAEFLGIVSSDAITVDDLRAGRYRDAVIVERVVDWRYPWAGDVIRNVYWVKDVTWSGKVWKVSLAGLAHRLQRKLGIVVGRNCRHRLYGPDCLVNPTPFTVSGANVSLVSGSRTFQSSLLGSQPDGYFDDGDLVWLNGPNLGIVSEVREFLDSGNTITLYIPTPFPITTSHTFTIRAGCDRLASTCKTKFSNFVNFGGFPFIPGRNKAIRGV